MQNEIPEDFYRKMMELDKKVKKFDYVSERLLELAWQAFLVAIIFTISLFFI